MKREPTIRRGIDLHDIVAAPAGEEAEDGLPMAPLGPLAMPPARAWGWKVLQWPLCRIVLATAAVWVGLATAFVLLHSLWPLRQDQTISMQLGKAATTLILAHVAYVLYVRLVEWRRAGEVSLLGAAREAAAGAAIGGGLMAAAVGILWLAGFYHVHGFSSPVVLVPAATVSLLAAYTEELGLRVICFRILEEWLGTGWALALSAAVFGFLHLGNPHATPISIASIALAGVLLGAAFAVTRRIWLPAGLHFAWNFAQGGIFGAAVSGLPSAGLLVGSLDGPAALSGGVFGVEGSLLSVALCAVAAVPLLRLAARRHHLVSPAWRARRRRGGGEPEGEPA